MRRNINLSAMQHRPGTDNVMLLHLASGSAMLALAVRPSRSPSGTIIPMSSEATPDPSAGPEAHVRTPAAHDGHGHAREAWSALASDARGRLVRVAAAIAVLWVAVAWALGPGAW